MTGDKLLTVDGLTAGYGRSEILHDISFDIHEGETISLLGRNGVGKTTTLRCIMGSLSPTSGTIQYRGEDLTGLDITDRVLRGLTIVPEDRRAFGDLTVDENLKVSGYAADSDRSELDTKAEIYDIFENLAARKSAKASTLSGGEQQMLAIAQALVTGADLIMFDEPTEGLAPVIVEELVETLSKLKETGCTSLIVEQNLDVALELSDRLYIIDQGRIVYTGTPEDITANQEIISKYLGVEV